MTRFTVLPSPQLDALRWLARAGRGAPPRSRSTWRSLARKGLVEADEAAAAGFRATAEGRRWLARFEIAEAVFARARAVSTGWRFTAVGMRCVVEHGGHLYTVIVPEDGAGLPYLEGWDGVEMFTWRAPGGVAAAVRLAAVPRVMAGVGGDTAG